ncbi:MAG: hypothetical protein GXO87_05200 [Chlorobi bacterium]|nr:hypothetical protein [Chlorobiota bacterium]
MKQVISFVVLAFFLASITSAQSSINIYSKSNNDVPKIIEKLKSLPSIEKVEKEQNYQNYFIFVKKGEEQSYKEIVGMWNDPAPEIVRVKGKIKIVMNDTYAGKFDDVILKQFKKDKNSVVSAELVDKGTFVVQFKDPGVPKITLFTYYFGRRVKPRPNPMTFDTLFKDFYFLPAE